MPKAINSISSFCTVPLRTLNLFVLHKLFLLDDSPAQGVLEIAERLVGLHAKRPQTPYLSVHARLPGFVPSQLNTLVYDSHTLLRAHCMRGTVHLLPLSRYRTVLSVTAGQLASMYRRAFNHLENKQAIENEVLSVIEDRGPLRHAEIAAALPVEVDTRDLYRLVNELCTRGILVKTTVNGSWRSSIYNYELLTRWQPSIPQGETDPLVMQALLIEWYLAAYGPATLADISWWTGLNRAQVKKALACIERPWTCVNFGALGCEAYIFSDDLVCLKAWNPPRGSQIALLPSFDPYIMAYSNRDRYIRKEFYSLVFKGVSGIIEPVILIDGWIIGTWKYSLHGDQVALEVFEEPGGYQAQRELTRVAKEMADFLVKADIETGYGTARTAGDG